MTTFYNLRRFVLAGVFVLPFLISGGAIAEETHYQISEVEIEGNQKIDADAIKAQLKSVSAHISASEISEDTKTLYRTGFFDEVSAQIVKREGRTILRYKVVEHPSVRKIFIKGNKELSEKDLNEVLKFDVKRFFDKTKLSVLIRNASTLYQSKGYYDASVSYSVVPVGDNQVDVTFEVSEGKKYKIKTIQFTGLSKIDEDDLRDAIQTKRYKWWSSWLLGTGRLNQEMLSNDRNIIRQYFLDHGFLDATVTEPLIEKAKSKRLVVTFDIKEGAQYSIGKITASGDLLDGGVAATVDGIGSKIGKVFDASAVRKDAFTISDKFGDKGFAFANVIPNTSLNRADSTVDLDFEVAKGGLTSINRINIKGNSKTYDHVIRRELKVAEQDLYSLTKVKRSQELLQRLGYFEEVNIGTTPTSDKDSSGNQMVDLDVNVREGSTGTFSIGAGFSSSDGALFNAKLSENNLFGTGRSADLNVDVGTQRNNVSLSYDDRRFNDTHLSVGGDVYYTQREYEDFDRTLGGVAFTAGYPLEEFFGESFEDISASLKYEFQAIQIENVDVNSAAPLVLASEGKTTASGITPRIVRNTINNPLNPTRGSRQSLSFEMTGLGGEEEYYLVELRNTSYVPLIESEWGDLVFSYRGSLGYGDTLNDEAFPLFRRYFPGGINSIRGYKARTLGPKDQNGNEYGGSKEFINNFETIFPLVNSAGLKGVLFYDIGNAFDDNQSIKIDQLRKAYGFGLRWSSPLGPIRIEFGFPLEKEEGESSMVTMFSFGAPFN